MGSQGLPAKISTEISGTAQGGKKARTVPGQGLSLTSASIGGALEGGRIGLLGSPTLSPIGLTGEVQSRNQNHNVIVIILDDVGTEKFEQYNDVTGNTNQTIKTPNIQSFIVDRGVQFNDFWAAPVCGPFRGALHSGLYPHHSGFFANIASNPVLADGNFYLGQNPADVNDNDQQLIRCLPTAMRAGRPVELYKFGKFGKSHEQEFTGHDNWNTAGCGWDRWKGTPAPTESHWDNWTYIQSERGGATSRNTVIAQFDVTLQLADIAEWLDDIDGSPFVMEWALNTGHAPYETPDPDYVSTDSKNEWIAAFGGSYPAVGTNFDYGGSDPTLIAKMVMTQKHQVEAVDHGIGLLIADLQSRGIYENTVFIVVGDNGTEISTVEAPFVPVHAKRSTYAQGILTPCWVAGPVVGGEARQSNQMINVVDIWPTILEIIGAYPQAVDSDVAGGARARDGVSFLKVLQSVEGETSRTFQFSMRGGPHNGFGYNSSTKIYTSNVAQSMYAVSNGTHKLLRIGGVTTTHKLFALPDYTEPDANDLLITSPTDPDTIAIKASLMGLLDSILTS